VLVKGWAMEAVTEMVEEVSPALPLLQVVMIRTGSWLLV
jgi:hypothetical protein